jgi:hypothetical protein
MCGIAESKLGCGDEILRRKGVPRGVWGERKRVALYAYRL